MTADRLSVVTIQPESRPVTVNDVALTRRLAGVFTTWFGPDLVKPQPAIMGGEGFSEFGRTVPRVPIFIWWVGVTAPGRFEESKRTGVPVPLSHSAAYAPLAGPTLKAGVTSLIAAVLEVLAK